MIRKGTASDMYSLSPLSSEKIMLVLETDYIKVNSLLESRDKSIGSAIFIS